MKDECIIVLQVKGIESRLKITEDRLFQERADRAGKLSEVEDKLLNENAKLQVLIIQNCNIKGFPFRNKVFSCADFRRLITKIQDLSSPQLLLPSGIQIPCTTVSNAL